MTYDWQAGLVFIALLVGTTICGKLLAFKNKDLQRMKDLNMADFKEKIKIEKYPPVMKASRNVGMYSNLFFFVAIAPFTLTLASQSIWKILLHTFVLLMVYDFFYYLMHRFLFHGQGRWRRIHAVHHQARDPHYIDAFYVHPAETTAGVWLFLSTVIAGAAILGPLHSITLALSFLVFTQLNTINHCHVDLPFRPFKILSWITAKHSAHHIDMHHGNYATITLLFDKLFGTFDNSK